MNLDYRQGLCCGITEVYGITNYSEDTDPKKFVMLVARRYFYGSGKAAYFMFVDVDTTARVEKLKSYIDEHKLGYTSLLPTVRNPNSGNILCMLVWGVNASKLKAWLKEQEKEALDKQSWVVKVTSLPGTFRMRRRD